MPQYEPAGKKTDMDEQGAFPKAPRERENLPPVEEGAVNLGRIKKLLLCTGRKLER